MITPSPELSEAVLLAVAFAERGCLPEHLPVPAGMPRANTPDPPWLTQEDIALHEPRVLARMAELAYSVKERPWREIAYLHGETARLAQKVLEQTE